MGYEFPMKFCQLIMSCIMSPKITIKINGNNYGYFAEKRGLRHGDPISPLLFVLVMKYLSRMLKKMGQLLILDSTQCARRKN